MRYLRRSDSAPHVECPNLGRDVPWALVGNVGRLVVGRVAAAGFAAVQANSRWLANDPVCGTTGAFAIGEYWAEAFSVRLAGCPHPAEGTNVDRLLFWRGRGPDVVPQKSSKPRSARLWRGHTDSNRGPKGYEFVANALWLGKSNTCERKLANGKASYISGLACWAKGEELSAVPQSHLIPTPVSRSGGYPVTRQRPSRRQRLRLP